MARIQPAQAGGANVCAFLDTLAFSEIGPKMLAASDDGYDLLVGSLPGKLLRFTDYSVHPHVLNAALNSTAAGRYQIIWPTWKPLQARLSLPDFSPISQDHAAIDLLRQGGALPHIVAGSISKAFEIAAAVTIENHEWASLPGSTAGQHTNKMLDLLRAFGAALAHYEGLGAALGV